ncbi:DUF4268 domain-containing protein, partial [Staphylococcus equorum]|uniref:DUF4268 domain-containing protein n=1 Tax=Staphylococcus equorum TaxID=246432 RepID=UPI003EB98329
GELDWERLDGKRASRIAKRFSDAGLATPESWPKLQDQMIETMIRLEKVLKPRLMKVET